MSSVMRDAKVATFHSPHMAGDVKVEYCDHAQMLALRYHTADGVMSYQYDVTKPSEMRDLMLDAIDLAAKPIEQRN